MKPWIQRTLAIGFILLLGLAVLLALLLAREHARVERLDRSRFELCNSQMSQLQRIVDTKLPVDVEAHLDHHYLEHGLVEFCLGSEEPPVDISACLMTRQDVDHCYRDAAKRLLALYREKWATR